MIMAAIHKQIKQPIMRGEGKPLLNSTSGGALCVT